MNDTNLLLKLKQTYRCSKELTEGLEWCNGHVREYMLDDEVAYMDVFKIVRECRESTETLGILCSQLEKDLRYEIETTNQEEIEDE